MWQDRKHCGKRRKCWLPAFSPFTTMFSESFYPLWFPKQDCLVKGLNDLLKDLLIMSKIVIQQHV